MKKIFCLITGVAAIAGCMNRQNEANTVSYISSGPEAAYYSDWDQAIRYDADMQNMYANTPTKIEKPIDMEEFKHSFVYDEKMTKGLNSTGIISQTYQLP